MSRITLPDGLPTAEFDGLGWNGFAEMSRVKVQPDARVYPSDGTTWHPARRAFLLPIKALARLVRGKFRALLQQRCLT